MGREDRKAEGELNTASAERFGEKRRNEQGRQRSSER